MKPTQTLGLCLAGLIGACWLLPAGAAQAVAAEAAAHANWRAFMSHNTASAQGCFQAEYPNFVWEKTDCHVITNTSVHPVHSRPADGAAQVTGNGHDFVAEAAGLISGTLGTFPKVTGVTSEKSVGVAAFGGGGILGANEYTCRSIRTSPGLSAELDERRRRRLLPEQQLHNRA
jgi:hypothetical protein